MDLDSGIVGILQDFDWIMSTSELVKFQPDWLCECRPEISHLKSYGQSGVTEHDWTWSVTKSPKKPTRGINATIAAANWSPGDETSTSQPPEESYLWYGHNHIWSHSQKSQNDWFDGKCELPRTKECYIPSNAAILKNAANHIHLEETPLHRKPERSNKYVNSINTGSKSNRTVVLPVCKTSLLDISKLEVPPTENNKRILEETVDTINRLKNHRQPGTDAITDWIWR